MRQSFIVLLALFLAPVASAQNPARGWFTGADAGLSQLDGSVEIDDLVIDYNDEATSFAVHAGYRFNRVISLGVFYANFGDYSVERSGYDINSEIEGSGINFVGRFPLTEKVGLLGNVIAMVRRLEFVARLPDGTLVEEQNAGLQARIGLGVNYQFNPNVDLRLDFTHVRDVGFVFMMFGDTPLRFDGNLNTLTLGLRYKF